MSEENHRIWGADVTDRLHALSMAPPIQGAHSFYLLMCLRHLLLRMSKAKHISWIVNIVSYVADPFVCQVSWLYTEQLVFGERTKRAQFLWNTVPVHLYEFGKFIFWNRNRNNKSWWYRAITLLTDDVKSTRRRYLRSNLTQTGGCRVSVLNAWRS